MDIRRLESLLFQEHVVKAGQDHTCYGNNGALMAAALFNPVILDSEIRVLLVFELTDLLDGVVAGRDDVELVKVGDPHGIFIVGLPACNSPDVFRVGDNDMDVFFEVIKDEDSVFTSGFHADLRTVMPQEPVTAGNEVRVEGGEPLFPIRGDAFEVSSCDTDSNKFFVDVHTGTVVVNDTQHKKPPFKRSRYLLVTRQNKKCEALLDKD